MLNGLVDKEIKLTGWKKNLFNKLRKVKFILTEKKSSQKYKIFGELIKAA